jgi:S1-C subfamily serine protease
MPGVALLVVYDGKGNELSIGSGFWVSGDGKLVSNYHVIKDAEKVTAKAQNGATFVISGILFEDSTNDIVILQTEGTDFAPLRLGTSARTRQGDRVVVLGSPMGLQGTATEGIVSAVRRHEGNLIQITAAISPGSSGSPVIERCKPANP